MTANELVAKVKNLPPVSQAALKLVSLLDQPAISNEDIVKVLKCDNVLTAKLLRACNSPYFGLEESVSSVDQAVLMLGHQQILHIVLTLAFGGAMALPLPGYAIESSELWRHSITTATAAEIMAGGAVTMNVDGPVAFTVGLLHDIGKLVMTQALTADFQTLIRDRVTQRGISRCEAEQEILGTDHAAVGAVLLQSWRLPEDIVEAVANHHQPPLEPQPRLSALTYVANCVSHLAGSAPGWESYGIRADDRVAEALGLSAGQVEEIVADVSGALTKVDQFMTMA